MTDTLTLNEFHIVAKSIRRAINKETVDLRHPTSTFSFNFYGNEITYITIKQYQVKVPKVIEGFSWKTKWKIISHKIRLKVEVVRSISDIRKEAYTNIEVRSVIKSAKVVNLSSPFEFIPIRYFFNKSD